MTNPLLANFDTAPFSKIKPEHFLPAIKTAIVEAANEINTITNNHDTPTFENTIEALEFSGQRLDRITAILYNLNSAETNPAIQEATQVAAPLLAEHANDIILNEKLFDRIKKVYEHRNTLALSPEEKTLLDKKFKSFKRNGALLAKDAQQKLRKIDKELSELKLLFSKNVLADTQAFSLQITDEKKLKGLPEAALESALKLSQEKHKEGWTFTLDFPSYHAIVTYADDRELRKKMAIAYKQRGFQHNENNNEELVKKIALLRLERAKLLGYQTHAEYVLEERMAEKPQKVMEFLDQLYEKALPAAKKEFKKLQDFAAQNGIADLQIWDAAYFTEKLKKQEFDIDDKLTKPYFQLDKVVEGVFEVAQKLFDLNFIKTSDIDVYHEEVEVYKVSDNNNRFISYLYLDFYPRTGKRAGAWMTSYKNQWKKDAKDSRPHISIVCNFNRPTDTKPSLLTFREVTTLFHEFGHSLHGMLADTVYPSLSGTNVYWDFVELPSQIMENWAYERETLNLFAKHYENDTAIPISYIRKIKEAANFMEGLATIRQLSFGYLDMAWHHQKDFSRIEKVDLFEQEAMKHTLLYPQVPNTCMSTAFSHIFSGGYSSGYYSYKWAEVLDADAFELFLEKGIFDKKTAQSFKENILEKGGSEKPMKLYKKFRGRAPKMEALLKRAGLTKKIN